MRRIGKISLTAGSSSRDEGRYDYTRSINRESNNAVDGSDLMHYM